MIDKLTNLNLKKGNPSAFKDLFKILYPRLKGYCKLFISDPNQIEDLIQETFIVLWEKRTTIRIDQTIESYVFVILRNKCLNYLKKQQFENDSVNIEDVTINELQYLYQLDFTEKEEKSIEEQLLDSFKQAVEELPEKMQEVFRLCKIEGIKQKEVAEKLGISIKMVEKHVAKAKKQIHSKLIDQYPTLLVLITLWID